MKPSDLTPNKIEEAPMGALSKVGNYLGSKLPTFAPALANRATGKLKTGNVANTAWNGFQRYLGELGEEPTKENIIRFLQYNKYPPVAIKAAQEVFTKAETAAKAAADKAAGPIKPNPPPGVATEPDVATESKKPAHHLDIMRNYLDILRENDEAVVKITPQIASQAIMAAANAAAKNQYTQPQATPAPAADAKLAGGGPVARAQQQQQQPAPAPAADATDAKPAAPAAVSNTAAPAPVAQAGIGGGNTATTVEQLDTHKVAAPVANKLYNILHPLIATGDTGAIDLTTALETWFKAIQGEETQNKGNYSAAAESLKFSESFNPGKMLEKKVTKLTRIK